MRVGTYSLPGHEFVSNLWPRVANESEVPPPCRGPMPSACQMPKRDAHGVDLGRERYRVGRFGMALMPDSEQILHLAAKTGDDLEGSSPNAR